MEKDTAFEMMKDVLDGTCSGCNRLDMETEPQKITIRCKTLNRVLLQIWFPTFMGENVVKECPHRTEVD